MTDYQKACMHVYDNIDLDVLSFTDHQIYKHHSSLDEENPRLADDIYDLMEEYGDENDLPEGWWLEYGETEDVFAECMTLLGKEFGK